MEKKGRKEGDEPSNVSKVLLFELIVRPTNELVGQAYLTIYAFWHIGILRDDKDHVSDGQKIVHNPIQYATATTV